MWYVASPGGPLPSLFKLWPRGQKWPNSGGHIFYIGLYCEKHEKGFLSETRPDLDQVYLNYAQEVKNGPAPGITRF